MSNRRKQQQRFVQYMGIFLAVIMGLSLLLPLLQSNVAAPPAAAPDPTATPRPTQPAPIENLEGISFEDTFLHRSGLFTAAVPTGWNVTRELNNTGEAVVTMNNPAQLSVIEARIIRPTADNPVETAEDLDGIFTEAYLRQSWNAYTSWQEDTREVEGDQHIINFSLGRSGQEFIARQVAFTDGTWVYALRVVTPTNASDDLLYVLDNELPTFQPVERYIGARIEFDAFYDEVSQHIIRYPNTWSVVDSAPGAPTSISGEGAQLRVETINAVIDSEDAASDYVAGLRSGTEVVSVQPVNQFGTDGFRVAYQRQTLDGAVESGAVALLQGDEQTHVANILLNDPTTVDLNSEDAATDFRDVVDTLDSFSLISLSLASSN